MELEEDIPICQITTIEHTDNTDNNDDVSLKSLNQNVLKLTSEFKDMKSSLMQVLTMSATFQEGVAAMRKMTNEMNVIASTLHSSTLNLEAALKNVQFFQQPVSSAPPVTPPEVQYVGEEKHIFDQTSKIYDQYLDKYKFKGLTREVFIKVHLMGGFEQYMEKIHPGHTIEKQVFNDLKTRKIKYYHQIDRELVRLASPLHEKSYLSSTPGEPMYSASRVPGYDPYSIINATGLAYSTATVPMTSQETLVYTTKTTIKQECFQGPLKLV
jgi:hypothetical protein